MITVTATELPRLVACRGSRQLIERSNSAQFSAPIRDEGIAVHWIIERAIVNDGALPDEHSLAPNGVVVTADMLTHAADYLTTVRSPASRFEHDTTLSGANWTVRGRADHIEYNPVSNSVHVDDLKYGWRIVEPDGNWTLIFHAISFCISNQLQPDVIRLTIHQPRPYHPDGSIRTAELTYHQLMAHFHTLVDVLSTYNDTLTTGPQCHNCPAMGTCEAARKAALNVVDLSETFGSEELDNEELARELDTLKRASKMIGDRIDALENLARYRLSMGEVVNNYSLEQGLSNSRWKDGITPEIVLALTGVNVAQTKVVTPAEAKRRGINPEIITALTERIPTKLNLVRVDADKRAKRLLKRN